MNARRRFLSVLLALAAAPAARAQGKAEKVIGYLSGGQQHPEELIAALAQEGLVAGRDYRFEVRVPVDWKAETLARAAAELVATRPDVLLAYMGNRVGALAEATRTIPIVCGGVPDPVGVGLAASLRRPGGNVTGISWGFPEVAAISFGLLKRLRPSLTRVGFVYPPGTVLSHLQAHEAAAKAVGLEWLALMVDGSVELDRLLAPLEGQAMMVAPFKQDLTGAIQAVGRRRRVAMMGVAAEASLMGYWMEYENAPRRVAAILAKVVRGGNPAEIPFELPDRPRFVINRRVAGELGITIPPDVMLRATEVID